MALAALGGCSGGAEDTPGDAVSGGGVTLASVNAVLPDETEALPAGAGEDVVTANCTACHSAGMITAQPPLKPEQWAATVKKMREVYKAPVAEADVPAILTYLNGLSERQRSPAAAAAAATAAP